MAKGVTGLVWAVIWLLLLIFPSFWVAFFLGFWYVILLPVTVFIPQLTGLTDFLLKGAQFPYFCLDNMVHMRSYSEATDSTIEETLEAINPASE